MIYRVPPWVWGLGAIALGLRLVGLGQPQAIVFDETYYVRFALDYLQGTPSFDAHPPLGKYLIALGVGLGQWPAGWFGWPTVAINGDLVSPLAYRWLNALVGTTVPLLLAGVAYELSRGEPRGRQRTFALLAGLLMTLEGLTLVESRLALINIYGLALGLLGQWAWLRAKHSQHPSCWYWTAGIAFGAAINAKWSWAGLWLGLVLWEGGRGLVDWRRGGSHPPASSPTGRRGARADFKVPLPLGEGFRVRAIPWRRQADYLGVLPLLTYLLLWLPHLALAGDSLLGLHRQIWAAHQSIGQNASHPYCSPWYSWPLLLRPVSYFYDRTDGVATAIHALGNPVLWWLGTAAMVSLAIGGLVAWGKGVRSQFASGMQRPPGMQRQGGTPLFIVLNYMTSWLPWALVGRCTFFYHAMGIATFSTLGLAWLMAKWLGQPPHRPMALALLGAIALGFLFWLPLFLGLPLSPEALQRRWLLPGWI